jgi:hypothetical protein
MTIFMQILIIQNIYDECFIIIIIIIIIITLNITTRMASCGKQLCHVPPVSDLRDIMGPEHHPVTRMPCGCCYPEAMTRIRSDNLIRGGAGIALSPSPSPSLPLSLPPSLSLSLSLARSLTLSHSLPLSGLFPHELGSKRAEGVVMCA